MSMLLAQCDELRKAAQMCRDLGRYETEQMLLDAADTILSLRDRAQALQAENDRLREYIERKRLLQDFARLVDEKSKLRELVKSMYYDLTNMTFPPDWVTDYAANMRELGIEAGDGVS